MRKTASAVVLLLSVLLVFSSVPLSVAFPLWGLVSGGAITVNLQSPSDGSTTIDNMPDFTFIATQSSQPRFSCSLWLQNATMSMVYATRDDVENGVLTTVTPSAPLPNGDWWWWISCADGSVSGVSDKRRVTVSVFRGDKTFTASFDGSTRYYWLDLPDNFDGSTPTPLVFYLHGYGGSRNSYLQQFPVLREIFQNHTWIVAAIECREVRGYDNWYTESTRQDITDVLNILRQTYSIDPSHVHIFGRSMGGSGSLKYAMYNNKVIASLVDIHGVSNFTQFYADTGTYKASLEAAYGGKPSTVPYVYKSESALGNEYRLENTPVMILHGTADDQVKVSESRNLYQSLSALGYTVRYIEVPGGGHTPSIAYGREMEIFNWFNDHPLWCASEQCRMWGMVSPAFPSGVVVSQLVSLTDSLKNLGGGPHGTGNVNGWGLVYYESGVPVVVRGQPKAYTDGNFNVAAQALASSGGQVGMGHVRNAASGAVNIPDPHPFVRVRGGKTWTLAHNGVLNIANLKALIGLTYLSYFTPSVGSDWNDPDVVDSDLYLIYILKCVEESGWDVKAGIAVAETEIYRTDSSSNANFLLSDGTSMWGYRKSVDSSHTLYYKYDASQHYSAIVSQPPEGSGLGNWVSMSNFNLVEISADSPPVLYQDIRSYGLQADDFTVVVLPDTQWYSESYPAIFNGQTQWVSSNKIGLNVVFVTHEGDLVNTNSQTYEWLNADSSMSILDEANIPWGVLPGNHDLTGGSTKYNTYFGYSRFSGLSWYGGAYQNVNTNNYELFTGGLDDYLIFHFQYQPSTQVLAWANSTIASYPGRRVIVTTHDYMNTDGSRTATGNNIWNKFVKPHADQVFLVLCGHNHGENEKIDVVKGHTVYQLLADYQDRSSGGNGWLRILEFHPSDDDVIVKTYSPYLGQYETDADSSFTLSYDMTETDSGWSAHTTFHVRGLAAGASPVGLSPSQIRAAYNLPSSGGSGTIAIIDAFDDPTVQNDLAVFSSQYGLPPPDADHFEIHKMSSSIPVNSGWALEISLDVQWAHAVAPDAKILLVEARSNSLANLLAAVDYARGRSDVVAISMSWGGGEFSYESSYDYHFTSSYGAAFFASSGDSGAGVIYPSTSPNVICVGGTTLTMSGNTVASETAWSGSGGGVSAYEAEPSYQVSYNVPGANGKRAVPDVSYDADPYTGFPVYDTTSYGGQTGWFQVGGTSAGAPQWAAIQSLGETASNNNFYLDAKSSSYPSYFRDVTAGSNGAYSAATGYDLVTGLGSPLTTNYLIESIQFTTSGMSNDASGTVLTIDSTAYTYAQLQSLTFSWAPGSTHTVTASDPVSAGSGKRYRWMSWTNGDGLSGVGPGTYTVPASSQTVTVNYKTQYYLTVNNGGHGTPSGEGWYDANTNAQATITPLTVPGSTGVQYAFTGWIGDASGSGSPSNPILMDRSKTATAQWKTQYKVSFDVSPIGGGSITNPPSSPQWYDAGATGVSISATPSTGYTFSSWASDPASITFADAGIPSTTATIGGPGTITARAKPSVLVVWEDGASFWKPASGGSGGIDISIADETTTVHSGSSSLKYQIVAGSKAWVTIYHDYASPQDWSGYDALAVWWYGQNTGASMDVYIYGPDWSNRFTVHFVDDFTGWGKVALPMGGFTSTGSPSWSAVRSIQIATGAPTPTTWYLDATTLEPATRSLTVNTVGSGSVDKVPDAANYVDGSSVKLTATPAAGWVFSGWSGDLGGSSNPTTIVMNGNKAVTATFAKPSVLVVWEDGASFWKPASGGSGGIDISIADETTTVHSGSSSLKYQIVAGSKAWVTIYHDYASPQDWSGYDALAVWWYGQNTGASMDVYIYGPDWSNRFTVHFVDDFTGWGKVALPMGGFTSTGSPSWSAVRSIQIATGAPTPTTWYFDLATIEVS